jgi:hypothetical protein
VRLTEIPSAATWNVLPFATLIGWPLKFPNHTRSAALSVISHDTIDQAPPDPFVHEIAVVCGQVTADPADEAVDAVENAVPPVVYPVPVSSVPDADALDAVEVSFSFIADPPSAVIIVPGTPAVPVGSRAFRILLTIAWSIAAIAVLFLLRAACLGHELHHGDRPGRDHVAVRVKHLPADLLRLGH